MKIKNIFISFDKGEKNYRIFFNDIENENGEKESEEIHVFTSDKTSGPLKQMKHFEIFKIHKKDFQKYSSENIHDFIEKIIKTS